MRNSTLFLFVVLFYCTALQAQQQDGLPPNPQPGKCYMRCITEDKWRDDTTEVETIPAYKKLEVIPEEYKDVEEQVMVKPPTKRYEYVPAVFKKVTSYISVEDPYNKIEVTPAKFTSYSEEVIVRPAYSRFEWKSSIENCKDKDPRNCMVMCFVSYPEDKITIPSQRLEADSKPSSTKTGGKTIAITKDTMISPPQVKEIDIPAEFVTIKKRVLVKDQTVREVRVPAQKRIETVKVLEQKGGMAVWEEIDCDLLDPVVLPIYYDFNKALLTSAARKIIDEKLLSLMNAKPLIRVEINSHTDSRGTDEENMDLSQRRAQAVVDYLISKGIRGDRLTARGYGETRLKEPCPDGVDCTEEQHATNRRTEFKVLPNF